MRRVLVLMTAALMLGPPSALAQDGRAALESAAKALGAAGETFAVGQSTASGAPWPRLNLKSVARLGLAVDQLLPLHGRIVPVAELNKAIGRNLAKTRGEGVGVPPGAPPAGEVRETQRAPRRSMRIAIPRGRPR